MALKSSDLILVNRGSDSYKSTLTALSVWMGSPDSGLVIPVPQAGPGISVTPVPDSQGVVEIAVDLKPNGGLIADASGLAVNVDGTSISIIDNKVKATYAEDSALTEMARNVEVTSASNSFDYHVFFGQQNGKSPIHSDTQLKYNPSTDELFSTKFNGSFVGDGSQLINLPSGIATGVEINYNNNSNSNYQMLWGSGNNIFGTAGITCNPFSDSIKSKTIYTSNFFRSTGNSGWYSETYGGGIFMQDSTWVRVYGNKAFYVNNNIAASGDVTAFYSDERLKDIGDSIPNALDKVCELTGFYYTTNEKAREFGYTSADTHVGVSAQKVQEVLPEVVTRAPFDTAVDEEGKPYSQSGEEYLTVKYDKLVPLLIEAIKELKAEIDELKS